MNRALFNVNYEYRYKLFVDRPARYFTPGRFAHDLSVGSHVGLGNVETLIWGQVEYRSGWGLPFAVHVTHYRYYRQGRSGIAGSSDWINLSFEYRF